MSDGRRPARVPAPAPGADQLVVRTPRAWLLTPAPEREPTTLTSEELRALLRGTATSPGRRRSSAPTKAPVGRSRTTGSPSPLARDVAVAPLPAFVARVSCGALIVEGRGGTQLLLDEIDLALVEAVTEGLLVGEVIDTVQGRLVGEAPTSAELGDRLRRLASIGRLLLDEPTPPDSCAAPETTAAEEHRSPIDGTALHRSRHPFGVRSLVGSVRRRAAGRSVRESAPPEAPAVAVAGVHEAQVGPDAGPAAAGPMARPPVLYLDSPVVAPTTPGAVPVYAAFQVATGPPLSLGMLTACARQYEGGTLNGHYELRRPEDPASFLADLAERPGPAVLLLSNYVWSLEHNLDVARRAKAQHPDLVVIHGGPSTPKFTEDCERFFSEQSEIVDVAVRGEGEITLAEALLAMRAPGGGLDLSALAMVAGLTFRRPSDGAIVRTDDRPRLPDLDVLPSPYLTGEFDHLDPSAWVEVTLETSRGCPYGCTFCDWGSSTLSRLRKFDVDRVTGEMEWAGRRRFASWAMGDANFGIVARDVEVARRIAAVKARSGFPEFLGFNVAKNTTRHLTAIVDLLVAAGVGPVFSLALQTRDDDTLEAVRRTNISTDHYTDLASSMRRRGLPLQADLMLGLPGQTVASLCADLQFLVDHEIPARMWITHLLPNAPINEPEYRERWQVVANEAGVVVSTRSFSSEDRAEMIRLRHAYTVFERFGLLRHVGRHVQWDHGVPMLTLVRRILAVCQERPDRYPLLNWSTRYFDCFSIPPLGWQSFYDELRRFLAVELDIPASPALNSVLSLQAFLMPEIGREFPATIELVHDYPAYFEERTRGLWSGEVAATSGRPLASFGPGTFTVHGDPLARCTPAALRAIDDPRNEAMTDDFWMAGHWELDSSLVVNQADVAAAGCFVGLLEQVPSDLPPEDHPG